MVLFLDDVRPFVFYSAIMSGLYYFSLVGCGVNAVETDVKSSFVLNSSPSFEGYYYLGSNSDFHFFVSKWSYAQDHHFKISKSQMPINQEKKVGSIEQRISLINKSENIFSRYKSGSSKIVLYVVDAT